MKTIIPVRSFTFSKILRLALSFIALCVAASAQEQSSWQLISPADESFTVRMPRSATRVYREVRLQENLGTVEPTYEADLEGVRYIVLSSGKGRPPRPVIYRKLESFSTGVEYALRNLKDGRRSTVTRDKTVEFDGKEGRQYRVQIGEANGIARVLETDDRFYVLLALASPEAGEAQSSIMRFLDSFTVGAASKTGVGVLSDTAGSEVERKASGAPANPFPLYTEPKIRMPISAGILNGKATARVAPAYPQEAKGAAGAVSVRVLVDETGKVVEAEAVSGHPLLRQAAVDAAYKWRFSPTTLMGKPVKVSGTINFNFVLE